MRSSTVYALIDPSTNEARYVGVTISKLSYRLSAHCSWSSRGIRYWVASLKERKLKPVIIALEEGISKAEESESERFWIAYLRSLGADLLNVFAGGKPKGPAAPSPVSLKITNLSKHLYCTVYLSAYKSGMSINEYLLTIIERDCQNQTGKNISTEAL